MSDKNYIRSDGNGGLEGSIQKAALRRWGPIGAAAFLVIAGLGSQLGQEAWDALFQRGADLQRLHTVELETARNAEADRLFIEETHQELRSIREEYRSELRAIRRELSEIKTLLIEGGRSSGGE